MTEQPTLRPETGPGAAPVTTGRRRPVSLILYLPFGIVRGQLAANDPAGAAALLGRGQGLVEIEQAVVEHYSNHLPTGNYSSLFVNLQQISGFSIIEER